MRESALRHALHALRRHLARIWRHHEAIDDRLREVERHLGLEPGRRRYAGDDPLELEMQKGT